MLEFYLLKDKKYSNFHFSYGPAFLLYQDGGLSEEVWYKKGEEHREDGPAVISYDPETGNICDKEFYIEGEEVE